MNKIIVFITRNSGKVILANVVVLTALFAGCSSRNGNEQTGKTFPIVTVPAVYADPQTRAEYLLMHYWDNFDFGDTAYVGNSAGVTEQAIVDYISIFPYAPYNQAYEGIQHTLSMSERHPAMYAFFTSMMERYLFDINSQLHNDEYFIPVLEHLVSSVVIDEYHKVRPQTLLTELQKNRPGTQAQDILFLTPAGKKDALSNVKTDFTLVMFHNLDCGNCREMAAVIESAASIKEMQRLKRLTIIALYPGSEIEEWKKHAGEMPPSWVHGYDYERGISDSLNYALRIIPTLYLYDKDRMVIMRDVPPEYVDYYMSSILNPAGANPAQ